ncbi:MAG: copper-binding protein [Burkholderiaceae bacterium]
MFTKTATVTAAVAFALLGTATAHAADGEVRKIDRAQAKLTLAHGEIKSMDMPAMTMVYRVKPPTLLDGLAVGDKVEFTAEKTDGQYVVTAIKKK